MLRHFGLFALRRRLKNDLQTRLLGWMSGAQGLVDLCLRGTDLTEINELSPLSGMSLTDPVKFKRYRPDGVVVEWTLRGSNNLRQPFFIQDATPVDYRIPIGNARVHKNGALGISEVRVAEHITISTSNVQIQRDPALHPESFSVTILSELEVADHMQGPDFFNADIALTPASAGSQRV